MNKLFEAVLAFNSEEITPNSWINGPFDNNNSREDGECYWTYRYDEPYIGKEDEESEEENDGFAFENIYPLEIVIMFVLGLRPGLTNAELYEYLNTHNNYPKPKKLHKGYYNNEFYVAYTSGYILAKSHGHKRCYYLTKRGYEELCKINFNEKHKNDLKNIITFAIITNDKTDEDSLKKVRKRIDSIDKLNNKDDLNTDGINFEDD